MICSVSQIQITEPIAETKHKGFDPWLISADLPHSQKVERKLRYNEPFNDSITAKFTKKDKEKASPKLPTVSSVQF